MNTLSAKQPTDAPAGYFKNAMTPWGCVERCNVVKMPSLLGGFVEYASVYKPASNPGVRWSVFEIKEPIS